MALYILATSFKLRFTLRGYNKKLEIRIFRSKNFFRV